MNLHLFPSVVIAGSLLFCNSIIAQSADDILPYIQQHQKIAVQAAQNTGIPASILLSQAILESNAGKNHLVLRGNNHFALKCGQDWLGETYDVVADEFDLNGDLMTSCFRHYNSSEAAYKDFADFLSHYKQAERFGFLFKLPKKDYQAWAYGIEQVLHPQQKGYSTQLVQLIEDYKLSRFDHFSEEDMLAEEAYSKTGFVHNNRVQLIYAEPLQSLEQIAAKYNVKLNKLLKYNDLEGVFTDTPLEIGVPIYLQPKKAYAYDKTLAYHEVKLGDNMHKIAQMYGIRLKDLYKRNEFAIISQPLVGQHVMLREVDPSRAPSVRHESETTAEIASKNSADWNTAFEEPLSTPNRTDEKEHLSDELPPILPKNYDRTASAPHSPIHFNAPAQDPLPINLPESTIIVPENPEQRHNFIDTEPTLTKKLTPIKPKKVSVPVTSKTTEQRTTTYLPPKSQPNGVSKPNTLQPSVQKAVYDYHFVRNGETLFGISKKYGTNVDTLKRLNRMTDNRIVEGQKLRVK
jgi:LysM repeat protein